MTGSRDGFPTKSEFQTFLRNRELNWIIDTQLFAGAPFYSARCPEVHERIVRAIARGLQVPESDICVVGSARVGFSLSPYTFGQPFGPSSDIDIVVVSPRLFDPSWLDLAGKRRTRSSKLSPETRAWLRKHREEHFVYNGWIVPAHVVEALEIGERWLRTFNALSQITELNGRPVSGRLYRTWDHARLYHHWSLGKVRQHLSV